MEPNNAEPACESLPTKQHPQWRLYWYKRQKKAIPSTGIIAVAVLSSIKQATELPIVSMYWRVYLGSQECYCRLGLYLALSVSLI